MLKFSTKQNGVHLQYGKKKYLKKIHLGAILFKISKTIRLKKIFQRLCQHHRIKNNQSENKNSYKMYEHLPCKMNKKIF